MQNIVIWFGEIYTSVPIYTKLIVFTSLNLFQKEISRLRGLVGGGVETQDNDSSIINFPGSPVSFKWDVPHESLSPLTSVKRMSQVVTLFLFMN